MAISWRSWHRQCAEPPEDGKEGGAQEGHQRPALPGKLADCSSRTSVVPSCFWSRATRPAARAKQARDRAFQAIMPLRGKILNTWEVALGPGSGLAGGARYLGRASASNRPRTISRSCATARSAFSPMPIPTGAHRHPVLCAVPAPFQPLVEQGHVYVAKPPLYRIDVAKDKFYALDEAETRGHPRPHNGGKDARAR